MKHNYYSLDLKTSKITDSFWNNYIALVKDVVIPYQWEALNDRIKDAAPSYAIKNFKIAAGLEVGEFGGMVFQDSDLAKWLEAVGYSLQTTPDKTLEALADSVIDLLEKAQGKDGYLNTYFTLKSPDKRWTNLWECHELYCAGHMMEASVAYYYGTGKRKFLDIMCRFADYIDTIFGSEPEKLKGYSGHPEIELALYKLYGATENEKYLKLSKYFIDERGQSPNYFQKEWKKLGGVSHWGRTTVPCPDGSYTQSHIPVREQTVAIGHAVRGVYLYSGMADIARETNDDTLLNACKTLWENIVTKQMYITGGIGSTKEGEAFTFDYDLPNDTVYAETCASIGLIFFAKRMLLLEAKGEYADVIERALFNTVMSAMSLDGKKFFYVNPLEVWPEASEKSPIKTHIKIERQKWFACACCPPNIARLFSSLGEYIYTYSEDSIYLHQYIGGTADIEASFGRISLALTTNYPFKGDSTLRVKATSGKSFKLALRIPGWCNNYSININGQSYDKQSLDNGYALIERKWLEGDIIGLSFDMTPQFLYANPKVRADAGKVALQRGPLVYCLEEADNGDNLSALSVIRSEGLSIEEDNSLIQGGVIIKAKGLRLNETDSDSSLYSPLKKVEVPVDLKAIPYSFWGNRKLGEMLVWIREK